MNSPPDSIIMSRPTSGAATPPRPARSRTQSISSDRPSLFAYSLMSPPLAVSPEAAFIAASAASQIVTSDHDTHAAMWYDQHGIEPSGETALVSSAALQLVNNFLDQLLFNILSKSRSTSLASLRPAVTDVLKPKLAKDAINQADEELREYLGGGDEEELLEPNNGESSRDWDLELVWKRTRLRCMVYSSLGDMEEEDEDYYMDQEGLELDPDEQPFDIISPAVAIFLTSILEYMGEQALVVAGQGACYRLQSRLEKEVREGKRDPNEAATRVVVDELDMDRVALDRTLGRLWRAWKKRVRSPTFESRPYSRGSMRSFHFRQNSAVPFDYPLPEGKPEDAEAEGENPSVEQEIDELTLAAGIPLPTGHRDVDEIEVPGLVMYSDDEGDDDDVLEDDFTETRPKSMLVLGHPAPGSLAAEDQAPESRPRSNSVPTLPSITLAFRRGRKILSLDVETAASDATDSELDELADNGADAVEADAPVNGTQETGAPDQSYTELDEEPEQFEILTSSRVSISGGISPVPSDTDAQSRSSSRQAGRPTSLVLPRLVEVAGLRSPVPRSPSTQRTAEPSPVMNAAPNEHQGPQVLETIYRSPIASPVSRPQADRLSRTGSTHINPSISEAEEDASALSGKAESTPASASLPTPNSFSDAPVHELKASPHSTSHQQSTPSQVPPTTKVTILRTSDSDGRVDHVPSSVSREVVTSQGNREGAAKYPKLNTAAATIGMVSVVERSRAQEDYDEFVPTATPTTTARPTHTSGGSSVSSGASRLKTVRSSEESGGSARPEDVARNFEELIHSDQTIQYTLTPESMRDMDSNSLQSYSPVVPKSRRSDDIKRIHTNRSRSSSNAGSANRVAASPVEAKRKASMSRSNGHTAQSSSTSTVKPFAPVQRAPRKSDASSIAASHVHARDARVGRESTADFADFLRSTGPPGSDTYPAQHRRGMGSMSSAQGSIDTRRPSTHSRGPRLQARDATVGTKEDNSDLIDFIRRGPSNGSDAHRIPRAVAPFRTTMDSDQMSGAVGGKAIDATIPDIRYSQTSNSINDVAPSMHSSTNSQSALLKHKPSYQRNTSFDDDDSMPIPKRKTRRVKDPYSLDFSDEEDDEVFGLPQQSRPAPKPAPKPVQREESLAEFLMNYDPPGESARTAYAPPPQPQTVRPKKKSSTSNLIGRLRGYGSQSNNNGPTLPTITSAPRMSTSSNGAGYVPIQVNFPPGYDRYGPVDPPKTSSGGGGRVQMKRFEPRDPVSSASTSGTSDLAAFLRNSEPPPPARAGPQYSPPAQEQGGGSMSKMLGRRKKSLVA